MGLGTCLAPCVRPFLSWSARPGKKEKREFAFLTLWRFAVLCFALFCMGPDCPVR